MKFASVITLLSAFVFAEAVSVTVTYDYNYANANGSLYGVACSDGANGLVTKGYTTFGSLPSFPYIGGIPGATWNSPLCGTCWALAYTAPNGTVTTVFMTAVDVSYTYNVSPATFNKLTNSDPAPWAAGRLTADATQVSETNCGFPVRSSSMSRKAQL